MPRDRAPCLSVDEEVEALIAACDESQYVARDKTIVYFSYDAGILVTEMARLKHQDVMAEQLPHSAVTIHSGRNPRIGPLSDRAFGSLLDMLGARDWNPDAPLFLPQHFQDGKRPFVADSIEWRFKAIARRVYLDQRTEPVNARSGRRWFVQAAVRLAPLAGAKDRDIFALTGIRSREALTRSLGYDPGLPSGPAHLARQRAIVNLIARGTC